MTQVQGEISLERRGGAPWAILCGEVDMDVVLDFPEDVVAPFVTDGPFYIDMTNVEFVDSSVIAWLLRIRNLSPDVHVVGAKPRLLHLLDVSGVLPMFSIDASGSATKSDAEDLELELPVAVGSSAEARRAVRTAWPDLGDTMLADLALIVTELVNNARRHGQPAIHLRLRREPPTVGVGVLDHGAPFTPEVGTSAPDASAFGGRGLFIVDRLANSWHIEPLDDQAGKTVWASIDVNPDTKA